MDILKQYKGCIDPGQYTKAAKKFAEGLQWRQVWMSLDPEMRVSLACRPLVNGFRLRQLNISKG